METDTIGPNQKGAVGEALVFGGKTVPDPVENKIRSFVEEMYPLAEDTRVRISHGGTTYFKVSDSDRKKISTEVDGSYTAKVIPDVHENNIERGPDGRIKNRWNLQEEVHFPVEVKTGEYAELERDQKEVLETISNVDSMRHPMLLKISIEKLPDEYDLSIRML